MPEERSVEQVIERLLDVVPDMVGARRVVRSRNVSIKDKVHSKAHRGLPPKHRHVGMIKTITLSKTVTAEDGTELPRIARATVDKAGNILKTTSSR